MLLQKKPTDEKLKTTVSALLLALLLSGCAVFQTRPEKAAPGLGTALRDVEFLLERLMSPPAERRRSITADFVWRNDIQSVHSEVDQLLAGRSKPVRVNCFQNLTPCIYEWDAASRRLIFQSHDLIATDFLVHVERAEGSAATLIRLGHWLFSVNRKRGTIAFDGFLIVDPP